VVWVVAFLALLLGNVPHIRDFQGFPPIDSGMHPAGEEG
jgi:hypothetical protein